MDGFHVYVTDMEYGNAMQYVPTHLVLAKRRIMSSAIAPRYIMQQVQAAFMLPTIHIPFDY